MTRPLVAVAVLGALALFAVLAVAANVTLAAVLTVVWAGAWLYRFWELR